MKKKNKFVRISLSENNIKKYKGKMKLRCLLRIRRCPLKSERLIKEKGEKVQRIF